MSELLHVVWLERLLAFALAHNKREMVVQWHMIEGWISSLGRTACWWDKQGQVICIWSHDLVAIAYSDVLG